MNWADHCDSDSDSDDGLHPVRFSSNNLEGQADTEENNPDAGISFDDEDSIDGDEELELEEEEIPFPPPIDMNNLPDNFPSEAPYSAYVGNVAFNIKTEQAFGEKIEGLVKFRYQNTKRVKVINARFGMDRATNQRKGFGYVEFETPEEVSESLVGCSSSLGISIFILIYMNMYVIYTHTFISICLFLFHSSCYF